MPLYRIFLQLVQKFLIVILGPIKCQILFCVRCRVVPHQAAADVVIKSLQHSFCKFTEKHSDSGDNVAVFHDGLVDKVFFLNKREGIRKLHKIPCGEFFVV